MIFIYRFLQPWHIVSFVPRCCTCRPLFTWLKIKRKEVFGLPVKMVANGNFSQNKRWRFFWFRSSTSQKIVCQMVRSMCFSVTILRMAMTQKQQQKKSLFGESLFLTISHLLYLGCSVVLVKTTSIHYFMPTPF